MSDPFDPACFRLPPGTLPRTAPEGAATRSRRTIRRSAPFLKGPIPWDWLTAAMRLPGATTHVALVLWFEAGRQQTTVVALSLTGMRAVGVSRSAAGRALRTLEETGLVAVERHNGRKPRVRLRDCPVDRGLDPLPVSTPEVVP